MSEEEINSNLQSAKTKLDELANLVNELTPKVDEANIKLEELKQKALEGSSASVAIQEIKNSLESLKTGVEAKKIEIEQRIQDVDNFYNNQYLPLRDNILDANSGLQATLSNSKQSEASIKSLEEQARIHFDSLKNSIEQYNNTLKSLNDAQATINSFFESSKTTANDQLSQIQIVKTNIEGILENIKALEKNSNTSRNEIEELGKNAKAALESIIKIKEDSESIKGNINDIYEQATNDTQGGAFGKQVESLSEELDEWAKKIQRWTLILLGTIIAIFIIQACAYNWDLSKIGGSFYLRFTFTTPIIFYLAFCTKQYGLVRKTLDKYAFKKVMALSVDHHTQILKNNFPSNEKERKEFSLEVLYKIYETPYYDEAMKRQDRMEEERIKFGTPEEKGILQRANATQDKKESEMQAVTPATTIQPSA